MRAEVKMCLCRGACLNMCVGEVSDGGTQTGRTGK